MNCIVIILSMTNIISVFQNIHIGNINAFTLLKVFKSPGNFFIGDNVIHCLINKACVSLDNEAETYMKFKF